MLVKLKHPQVVKYPPAKKTKNNCSSSEGIFFSIYYISWIKNAAACPFSSQPEYVLKTFFLRKVKRERTVIFGGVERLFFPLPLLIPLCVRDSVGGHAHGAECFHLGLLQSRNTPTNDLGMCLVTHMQMYVCTHGSCCSPAYSLFSPHWFLDCLVIYSMVSPFNNQMSYGWLNMLI